MSRVENMSLCFFETGVRVKSIVSFGEYVAWPKNARGATVSQL